MKPACYLNCMFCLVYSDTASILPGNGSHPNFLLSLCWHPRWSTLHYCWAAWEFQIPTRPLLIPSWLEEWEMPSSCSPMASVGTTGRDGPVLAEWWKTSLSTQLPLTPSYYEMYLITSRWGWKSGLPNGIPWCKRGMPLYHPAGMKVHLGLLWHHPGGSIGVPHYSWTRVEESKLSTWPSLDCVTMGPQIFLWCWDSVKQLISKSFPSS